MRTRNKPAKDQPSNKRPKRGVDNNATDTPTETAKTPNKTADKRKSTRDTPTKGKKRANIDMDTDNDGSEEKEKRKRTDVSFIFTDRFQSEAIAIYILLVSFCAESNREFELGQSARIVGRTR